MMKNRLMVALFSFLLTALTIWLYAVGTNEGLVRKYFSYGGYWFMLVLILVWALTLVNYLKNRKFDFLSAMKSNRYAILFCLVLAIIVFVSVKPYFRVLSDETNLVGVSKSMLYERRVDNVTMGKWYFDLFTPLNRAMEKRPLMFPFFEHIMHMLFGYRAENVFLLNFFVLFSLFFVIYAFVRSHLGELWAASAVLLTASQPIVTQCATCGGFELCSALFLAISFVVLLRFLEEPSPDRLALLWSSLLMFSNIRYEGILAFIVTIGLLLLLRYVPFDYFTRKSAILYYSTPLLVTPLIWQRLLKGYRLEVPRGVAAFSLEHFLENNAAIGKSFIDFGFYLPYATIVDIIGLVGLLYLIYSMFAKRAITGKSGKHALIIVIANLSVFWVIFTAYYFGKIAHPSSSRFFVFFYIALSLFALAALSQATWLREKPVFMVFFSLTMFALYHPVSIEDKFSRTQTLPREYRFTMDFFRKQEERSKRFLVVAERPGQYTVHNYGAVEFTHAAKNYSIIMGELKNHLYNDVFVIQTIAYAHGRPLPGTTLDKRYNLEIVAESQNNAESLTRISRVKLTDPEQRLRSSQ